MTAGPAAPAPRTPRAHPTTGERLSYVGDGPLVVCLQHRLERLLDLEHVAISSPLPVVQPLPCHGLPELLICPPASVFQSREREDKGPTMLVAVRLRFSTGRSTCLLGDGHDRSFSQGPSRQQYPPYLLMSQAWSIRNWSPGSGSRSSHGWCSATVLFPRRGQLCW